MPNPFQLPLLQSPPLVLPNKDTCDFFLTGRKGEKQAYQRFFSEGNYLTHFFIPVTDTTVLRLTNSREWIRIMFFTKRNSKGFQSRNVSLLKHLVTIQCALVNDTLFFMYVCILSNTSTYKCKACFEPGYQ